MTSSAQQFSVTFCQVCKADIPAQNYESHVNGKKHKIQEERCGVKKNIEETGLFVRGVPPNVNAVEMSEAFGKFGFIAKIEIYGNTAYVNYADRSSCDEALKHKHIVRDTALFVERRKLIDRNSSQKQKTPTKRGFDNTPKNSPRTQSAPNTAQSNKTQKPRIALIEVLDAVAQPGPISEQIVKIKEIILAKPEYCSTACNRICTDLMNAMKASSFGVCELFAFGSMTTGLAFKDSDLDVYAHLELNPKTHFVGGPEGHKNPKKIFANAKSSLYKRSTLFKEIVPIQGAKVPIIKFVHAPTKVACDINFRDLIGYYNSNLLRHYLSMNERFFDMMVFLKFWAQVHDFCSSSKLSSFSLSMLALSFLLSLKNEVGTRILPTVDDLINQSQASGSEIYVGDWKCSFDSTPIKVALPDTPNYSLVGLLKGFFEYIAMLPFQTDVLSVSTGGLIPRECFSQPDKLPDAYLCYKNYISKHPEEVLVKPEHFAVIHDPFRLNHNLVGRVNLVTMQCFVKACKKASEDCAVAMNNKEMEGTLFHHLLAAAKSPTPVGASGSSKSSLPVKDYKISKTTSMDLINPFNGKENPCKDLTDLIYMIFEKILFLDVKRSEEETEDETNSKVSKTGTMENVHEDRHNHSMVFCEGQKDVWSGRRKAKQSLKLTNPLSFQDEVLVSKMLKQREGKDADNAPVSFQCQVVCESGKYRLLFPGSENQRTFKIFWELLQQLLPKWLAGLSSALEKSPQT